MMVAAFMESVWPLVLLFSAVAYFVGTRVERCRWLNRDAEITGRVRKAIDGVEELVARDLKRDYWKFQ